MENNLDKLFRDNLQNRQVEFQEAFWQEAEALIVADEDRKRRGLWMWWGIGMLVLLVTVGIWGTMHWSKRMEMSKSGLEMTEGNKQSKETATLQVVPADKAQDLRKEELLKQENSEASNSEINSENRVGEAANAVTNSSNNQNQSTKSTPPVTSDNLQELNALRILQILENTENQEVKHDFEQDRDDSIQPALNTQDSLTRTRVFALEDNKSALDTHDSLTFSQIFDTPSALASLSSKIILVENDSASSPSIFDDLSIPTPFINQKYDRNWAIGLAASTVLYPNFGNQSQQWVGFKGGVSANLRLKNNWSLGTEISYFQFRGTFENAAESLQNTYAFGLDSDVYSLKPSSLHFLEVPVLVKYRLGRHHLEAGVAADFLLGARGQVVFEDHQYPWQRTESENKIFEEELFAFQARAAEADLLGLTYRESEPAETNWVDTKHLKKVQPQLVVGYQYQASWRWQFGLRLQYRLTNGYNISPDFNADFLKEDGRMMVQVSAGVRLF